MVATREIAEMGVTEWKLSNGAKVVVKPTTFKNDEVRLTGFSPGGHSLVKDADYDAARFAGSIVHEAGLGPLDAVSLRKVLNDKIVYVNSWVGELEEQVRAGLVARGHPDHVRADPPGLHRARARTRAPSSPGSSGRASGCATGA